jgi:hypothetical protein
MMRKYIKLLESNTSPEILGFEKDKVILMNPDGEKVTIDIEVDDIGDRVDDYVREVSLSGDDGKYMYYFSGAQTDHHSDVDDIELQDWDTIENIKAAERKRQEAAKIRQAEIDERHRLHKAEEEKQRTSANMSNAEWDLKRYFEDSIKGEEGFSTPASEPDAHYVVLKALDSNTEEEWISYILFRMSDEKKQDIKFYSDLGLVDYPNKEDTAAINQKIRGYAKLLEIIELDDVRLKPYIKWIMHTKNGSWITRLMEMIDDTLTTE